MIWNIRLVAVFLLLAGLAQAAPFLVCDPVPVGSGQPTHYVITVDTSAPIVVAAHINPDGSAQLRWDVSVLSTGPHTITVAARNLWGDSDPVPFVCVKQVPASAQNTRLASE